MALSIKAGQLSLFATQLWRGQLDRALAWQEFSSPWPLSTWLRSCSQLQTVSYSSVIAPEVEAPVGSSLNHTQVERCYSPRNQCQIQGTRSVHSLFHRFLIQHAVLPFPMKRYLRNVCNISCWRILSPVPIMLHYWSPRHTVLLGTI